MKKFFVTLIFLSLTILLLSSCTSGNKDGGNDISYDMLDLGALCDAIYEKVDISDLTLDSVSEIVSKETLTEQYYLDLDNVISYRVRSAEGKFGVADIAIIRAKEGYADEIMESLEKRKYDRINEFAKYDVYDSYAIALDTDIYIDDELVIMLMLDKDSKEIAMETIESMIPRS